MFEAKRKPIVLHDKLKMPPGLVVYDDWLANMKTTFSSFGLMSNTYDSKNDISADKRRNIQK